MGRSRLDIYTMLQQENHSPNRANQHDRTITKDGHFRYFFVNSENNSEKKTKNEAMINEAE